MGKMRDLERRILEIERRIGIAPMPSKQPQKQRRYAPNDGSKSEWANTPEGREWWLRSQPDDGNPPWHY